MNSTAYATRYPYDLLVWNAGVWHLNSHHQHHLDAILAAAELSHDYGTDSLRIWDNHREEPLPGWAGMSA